MNNPLLSCVLKKDIETLGVILHKNTKDISADDMLYASLHAASITAKDIVNVFLTKGVHINDILTAAVKHSFKNATDTLLQMGGDVNHESDGYTLITLAAIQHDTECMNKLLHHGALLNLKTAGGETSLTCISQHLNDYRKEVQYLAAKGADVNLPNDTGETPLHIAAIHGNNKTVRTLLSIGAHINHQDNFGETALMIAAGKHDIECVILLLECGAKKDLKSVCGHTALITAIKNIHYAESYKIIDSLLENGCNTDIPDEEGQTPLYLAVELDERPMISKLLQFGADIFTETKYGMTPFLASIITGYDELAAHFIDMECYVSGHMPGTQDWKQNLPAVALMGAALSPSFNKFNCGLLNKFFFGAGEKIEIRYINQPHNIAIMATETKHETLMTITRHAIRSHISTLSSVNLITQVTKLPLPTSLKKFLYFL